MVQSTPRVVLSGDYNPAGIECLKLTLERLGAKNLRILCGFSPDKPYAEMYRELAGLSKDILLTQVGRLRDNMPEDYYRLGPFAPEARAAARQWINSSGPDDTVLITGSLYLIGELRSLWRSKVEFVASR